MIQKNQLRVGNWVELVQDDEPFWTGIIVEIKTAYAVVAYELGDEELVRVPFNNMDGISLNEGELMKFGFTVVGENIMSIQIDQPKEGQVLYLFLEYYSCWTPSIGLNIDQRFELLNSSNIMFDSVHQLQNLYFALTHRELNLENETAGTP